MEDIRREDRRLFIKELMQPSRMLILAPILFFGYLWSASGPFDSGRWTAFTFAALFLCPLVYGVTAWTSSERKRFRSKRMQALWAGCQDRLARFDEVLRKMRRDQVAELREMPKTIREVGSSIYAALRRADIIADEVQASERDMLSTPPTWEARTHDPQSKELYRLADKNIAEYRSHFAGVMAGVQRTEAQTAVYMTTLDTLRMKMIGYRLVGRSPELSSQDFLEALAEARAQLEAIDHALEELDLSNYPKQISVVPPPIPEDIQAKINLNE